MGRAVVVVKYFCGPVPAQLLARSSKPLISSFGIAENRLRQSQHESQLEGDIAFLLAQFNCSEWGDPDPESDLPVGLQCVDGLQRYTAVTEFVKGNVKPFGFTANELAGTQFSPKRMCMKVAIHGFTKRADLLSQYLALNAGGTPHSAEEIARVRALLAEAQTDGATG